MADLTLAALAKRVEAEEPSTSLWYDGAYKAIRGVKWHEDDTAASVDRARFIFLCQGEAYLDAADMLRPANWRVTITSSDAGHVSAIFNRTDDRRKEAYALGLVGPHAEARARLAAALRARDAGGT